jgi:hypothetical protein
LNPVIAGMNRFNALDHAVTFFELAGESAFLGLDLIELALFEEATIPGFPKHRTKFEFEIDATRVHRQQ